MLLVELYERYGLNQLPVPGAPMAYTLDDVISKAHLFLMYGCSVCFQLSIILIYRDKQH